jgi:hypothetical protein
MRVHPPVVLLLLVSLAWHGALAFDCPPVPGATGATYCQQQTDPSLTQVVVPAIPQTYSYSAGPLAINPFNRTVFVIDSSLAPSILYSDRAALTFPLESAASCSSFSSIAIDSRANPSTVYLAGPNNFVCSFSASDISADWAIGTVNVVSLVSNAPLPTDLLLYGIAFGGPGGNLYGALNNAIVKIDPASGSTTLLAGSPSFAAGYANGIGQAALFRFGTDKFPITAIGKPASITVDAQGTVYVIDTCNNCIRAIRADGNTTTLIGRDVSGGFVGTVLPSEVNSATGTQFLFCSAVSNPSSMQLDDDGMLWVWQGVSRQLITVTTISKTPASPAGVGTLVSNPFSTDFGGDYDIAVDSPNRNIALLGNYMLQVSPVQQASGICAAGYYCPPGSVQAIGSGPCLAGYQCPAGSSSAMGPPEFGTCPAGTYSNIGATSCVACIRGFYTLGVGACLLCSDEQNNAAFLHCPACNQ